MSLYITFDTEGVRPAPNQPFMNAWEWHVGEKNHFVNTAEILHIVAVQADGDELLHIYDKVRGLKIATGRVIRWFGDDAKFIVANCLK